MKCHHGNKLLQYHRYHEDRYGNTERENPTKQSGSVFFTAAIIPQTIPITQRNDGCRNRKLSLESRTKSSVQPFIDV